MAFISRTGLALLLVLAALHAGAQSLPPAPQDGWSPSLLLKSGTLGIGPEFDTRIPYAPFGIRADIDGFGFDDDTLFHSTFVHNEPAYAYDTRVRYKSTVKLLNGGLNLDYYPFGTGLRLSVGFVVNGNGVTAHGQPSGRIRIGTTTSSGVAPGGIDTGAIFNAVAPVVGVGYSRLLMRHLRVSLDAGAMVQGDPHLSFRMSGAMTELPSVFADAERERRRLQAEFNYPVYPVAMAGIGWQF